MTVHIEELFTAFQEFQNETRRATSLFREPRKQEAMMAEAQQKFKAFCDLHGLPVDFTP
jgi:hypothetical protein